MSEDDPEDRHEVEDSPDDRPDDSGDRRDGEDASDHPGDRSEDRHDAEGDAADDGPDDPGETWDGEHPPPNEDPDVPVDPVDAVGPVDAPESDRDGPKSLGDRLHEFAVDLLDGGTTSGERRGGRISYGYSARTGPDRPSGPATPHRRSRPSRGSTGPSGTDAHASAVRDGDDLLVTVDLPGVAPEDLTCGVDPDRDELVVGADGQVLSRVPLEGADHVVAASLNNHVLTVHLTDQ
ncbi:gas vesicle protein GvpH [Halorarum halobium]|uniref:gas vesicle protein GvpH n=1 Tax=Halorarum halobium TaxID=3075121 RepID=UPI0028AA7D11|nr:gas vesicle protein GvpH [Halobaculum sp. XH14]